LLGFPSAASLILTKQVEEGELGTVQEWDPSLAVELTIVDQVAWLLAEYSILTLPTPPWEVQVIS
jgi:hypothetical protein